MGEVLRHALAETLARGDLRDPDLQGVPITVTEVRPSPDLKAATVFVTPLGGGDTAQIVKALKRARGHLRAEIARKVEAKFTPELRFVADDAFDNSARISAILNDVSRKDAERSAAASDDAGADDDAGDDAARDRTSDGA
jgi:ribosome-binding factor A